MSEHALYVAVKEQRIRPPLGKLSQLYPHQLLLLIMEMWEGEPRLVRLKEKKDFKMVYIKQHFYKRPSMNQVVDVLSTYLT